MRDGSIPDDYFLSAETPKMSLVRYSIFVDIISKDLKLLEIIKIVFWRILFFGKWFICLNKSFVQTTIEWDGNTLVETQTWGNPPKSTTIRWSAEGDKMTAVSSTNAFHLHIFQRNLRLLIWTELFANDSMSALQNKQPIDASNWLLYEIIL